jgi:hypothetical protein
MSSLFQQEVSPSSLKIYPSNVNINSIDWFEFVVELMINNSEYFYHSGITFRNNSRSIVEEFFNKHKNIVIEYFKLMESCQ